MLLIVAKLDDKKSIKVLYPLQADINNLFENEVYILKKLSKELNGEPVENGVVRLIDSGSAKWKHDDDVKELNGRCTAIVYTFAVTLFPILRHCVSNNQKM